MLKVQHPDANEYSSIIDSFIARSFPLKVERKHDELLDAITDELLSTNKRRLGPKPTYEQIVEMRKVVSWHMNYGNPIPILVAWGSEKPDGSELDIAELGGLRTLNCLNERIKQHYPIGVEVNIRVEDASAPYLFKSNWNESWITARKYTQSLVNLVKAMDFGFINMKPESDLVDPHSFMHESEEHEEFFTEYIQAVLRLGKATPELIVDLAHRKWSGELKLETIMFYLTQYRKLYPEMDEQANVKTLARYFSSALARYRLNIRGESHWWKNMFLNLSFVQSPPGVERHFARRLLYRTLPVDYTSNHIPPWRAKGYLQITDDSDSPCPKLASFSDISKLNLVQHRVVLTNGDLEVPIRCDYNLQ